MANFWSRVEKLENGCWVWTGPRNRDGYGQLKANGQRLYAHRVAYKLGGAERELTFLRRYRELTGDKR